MLVPGLKIEGNPMSKKFKVTKIEISAEDGRIFELSIDEAKDLQRELNRVIGQNALLPQPSNLVERYTTVGLGYVPV